MSRVKGRTKLLATINQVLLRGLLSCRRVFVGRAHFSVYLLLLTFIKKVSLMNHSLDSACARGGHNLDDTPGYG